MATSLKLAQKMQRIKERDSNALTEVSLPIVPVTPTEKIPVQSRDKSEDYVKYIQYGIKHKFAIYTFQEESSGEWFEVHAIQISNMDNRRALVYYKNLVGNERIALIWIWSGLKVFRGV